MMVDRCWRLSGHHLLTPSYGLMCSLTVGGGYGFLSGEHGLVIDNVVGVTMVISDGSIVSASATEHPDVSFLLLLKRCETY